MSIFSDTYRANVGVAIGLDFRVNFCWLDSLLRLGGRPGLCGSWPLPISCSSGGDDSEMSYQTIEGLIDTSQ